MLRKGNETMNYTAIVLAAGSGSRTGLTYNKMFFALPDGRSVLEHSLDLFEQDPDCRQIVIVCAPAELEEVNDWSRKLKAADKIICTTGGATRQESVNNGIARTEEEVVFIHDGARPFLRKEELEKLKKAMETEKAALLCLPSVDTVKVVDENGYVQETLPRNRLFQAQTPQAFRTDLIKEAHRKAALSGFEATDDAQIMEVYGQAPVLCVIGDASNKKITHPADLK